MSIRPSTLETCRSLGELAPAAREAIAQSGREVEFRLGERLIPLGQPPERLLILTQGLVKLVGISMNGHERILNMHRPPDMVGCSVLMESPQNEHEVTAMTRVRALAISRRELIQISRTHPSVILALAREVSRQLLAMTERLMTVTSAEVPVRLSQLLLELADGNGGDREAFVPLTYPLTHESMAQIIGASRPHTSSVLRELENRGAVQRGSRSKLLVRPSGLANIVGQGRLETPVRRNGSLQLSA